MQKNIFINKSTKKNYQRDAIHAKACEFWSLLPCEPGQRGFAVGNNHIKNLHVLATFWVSGGGGGVKTTKIKK